MNKKLYKKDSKGKIRELHVYSDGDTLYQISGLIDGKKVTHSSVCKPKNVGKSNETTPEEQAIKQAESKIAEKIKEGYFETIEEAEKSEVILPMLAKDFNKEKKKIKYPCFAQPKLDGMRGLFIKNKLISRKNTPIDTLEHITNDLAGTIFIPDGELYAHGLSFQENMKLIKKYRKDETEKVKFHVYDIVSNDPFIVRYNQLRDLASVCDTIELVETVEILNEDELKEVHARFLREGYEGTMVRWGDEGYKVNGRSSNLLKYKDFIDMTAPIVDVVPSDKNPEQGVVHCSINGKTFGCGMKFSHKDRKEMLVHKDYYIGKSAEIRFFEYTDDGLPRFPVCVGVRLDK